VTERCRVYVGLGSNIEPERHVRRAVALLGERFGPLRLSPVYRSEAVGFEGAPFLNLVAGFDSEAPFEEVLAALRAIEEACGRRRGGPRFASRTLDADLLLYGEAVREAAGVRVPRPGIEREPFVLAPLADLAPGLRHPVLGVSIAELWARLAPQAAALRVVALELCGGGEEGAA